MDPTDIATIAKAVPEVTRDAYGDLASSAMKQAGKLAQDIAKSVRLILFPVQLGAALQDRLADYIDRAVRQVPEAHLVSPPESVMLPIAEKLRFQEPANPITELYINLLARAMDGERIGEAHPAFIGVIAQLAPDEVLFLTELSRHEYTLVLKMDEEWRTPDRSQIQQAFDQAAMPSALIERSNELVFNYDRLNQPDLFYVFLEHLYHLGLVQYTNDPSNEGEYKGFSAWKKGCPLFIFIRLSSFGKLFYRACVSS